MGIETTTFSALDAADVQNELAVIIEILQEANPSLDLRRGVLHDLLAYNQAALLTLVNYNLQLYLSARSLLQIQANPALADPDTVDDVLSNWNITRLPGAAATGEITIVLSAPVSVTIGAGTIFTANTYTFTANSAFTAKTSASLINSATDRLLTELPDGSWAFTVNVTATTTGAAYMITRNTLAVPATLPLDYVTSYATSDFTGGADPQTNAQLLTELLEGFAIAVPSNRVTMGGLLQKQPAFTGITNQSVIGYGDPEMLRDKHTIFPVAYGGRADWYVRSQPQVLQTTLAKTATLLSVSTAGFGTWQVSISRDDAPGFYEVEAVLPPGNSSSGSLSIVSQVGQLDLSGPGFVPDIVGQLEGSFTRYQTAIIQFVDDTYNQGSLAIGASGIYNVVVSGLPLIDSMQEFVASYDQRPFGTDVLIKAPIPCFVQLTVTVAKKRTQADPDASGIAAALAEAVNSLDFVGQLYAGSLQAIVQGFLTAGMSAGGIDMLGRIHGPDGVDRYIRDSELLQIPNLPAVMISPRTVQFFTDPTQIAVNIETVVPVST